MDPDRAERLEEAKRKLCLWERAEEAVATSQSYEIDGRALTRASLGEINKRLIYYRNEVFRLSQPGPGTGPMAFRIIPRDL